MLSNSTYRSQLLTVYCCCLFFTAVAFVPRCKKQPMKIKTFERGNCIRVFCLICVWFFFCLLKFKYFCKSYIYEFNLERLGDV